MESELTELWKNLKLTEEEEKGIQVGLDEFYKDEEWSKCCLIGKLFSKKHFNSQAFNNTMLMVWKEWGIRKIEEIRDNLFLFHFKAKSDCEIIIRNGPWNFDNKLVLLKSIEMGETPSETLFKSIQIWVQIFDLPVHAMTKQVGEKIGELFGKALEIKTDKDGFGFGSCLRIRVELRIDKKLLRRAKINVGMDDFKWVYFKYERLPMFCFVCGLLGHIDRECYVAAKQRKEGEEVNIQYGAWLRASIGNKEVKSQEEETFKGASTEPGKGEERMGSYGGLLRASKEKGDLGADSGIKINQDQARGKGVICDADWSAPVKGPFQGRDKAVRSGIGMMAMSNLNNPQTCVIEYGPDRAQSEKSIGREKDNEISPSGLEGGNNPEGPANVQVGCKLSTLVCSSGLRSPMSSWKGLCQMGQL